MDIGGLPRPDERKISRRIVGIMATYHRPQMVMEYLELLDRQIVAPNLVIVVDNGHDPLLADEIERRRGPTTVEYLDAGGNLGPAGALKLGLSHVAASLAEDDLVLYMDDDDPPVDSRQLERLVEHLDDLRSIDRRIAAIGLSGGTLNTRLGVIRKVDSERRFATVDHLHGGYTPVYLAKALLEVGGHEASYFFGFEELELGRRLTSAGWRLVVDNCLMGELGAAYPKLQSQHGRGVATTNQPWRRFHKERNLIRILHKENHWFAIAFTVLARHVARPVTLMFHSPRSGAHRMLLGLRATTSGLRWSGGIDHRYQPPVP